MSREDDDLRIHIHFIITAIIKHSKESSTAAAK